MKREKENSRMTEAGSPKPEVNYTVFPGTTLRGAGGFQSNDEAGRLMTGVNAACIGLRAEGRAPGVEVLLSGINELLSGKNEYFRSTEQYFPGKNEYFRSTKELSLGENELFPGIKQLLRSGKLLFRGVKQLFRSEKQLFHGVKQLFLSGEQLFRSGIAVGFSQRITDAGSFGLQPHILRIWLKPAAGNIEYRISNIESGSYALIEVSHSLFFISYFFPCSNNALQLPPLAGRGALLAGNQGWKKE